MVRGHREKVSRISFSLQPKLQREFDKVSEQMGYDERSKALHIAIRNMIADYELKTNPESSVTGSILMLYDHGVQGIDDKITEIGHHHRSVIVFSTHLHLSEESCLSTTVVSGSHRKIVELERDLRKLNGVKQLKCTYLAVGK